MTSVTNLSTSVDDLSRLAGDSLQRGIDHLLSLQAEDGHWCAELEGDSILQSEYLMMKWIIHQEDDPRLPRIADYLRQQQQEDGAWVQYPGGKPDLSATVKGYFVLKLMGDPRDNIDAPHMTKARELILSMGGAERANSYSKFFLACLGQISYSAIPSIPPQIVYLPKWFYFHLDKVSAWTRTMITPLSIVTSHKPVRQLPKELHIDELYVSEKTRHQLIKADGCSSHPFWSRLFFALDRMLKIAERIGFTPLREKALKRIEDWIITHSDRSEGLGAIFPPMVYIQIALRCRGYAPDHPVLQNAERVLDDLILEDPQDAGQGMIHFQPCFSPVWDTGIAAYALADAAVDTASEPMRRVTKWLLDKECREPGDWVANVRQKVAPSGWFFEYKNGFYPDVDDTAMVAMALKRMNTPETDAAAQRGVDWMLAMQNSDGGWAAFDRTQERPILEYVPFADHNAIQDPSCPDITGRTLECLGWHGYTTDHPAVQRAIAFVRAKQHPEGCWFGRWGVNYIYGTWQAICGLPRVGQDMNADWIQRAGQWLKSVQQHDGSFGESADSYEDESLKGQGPPTPSQTAWGAMGMMAVFGPDDPDVQRALKWLCDTQLDTGTWDEPWFTGTGFPRVFYLRYHLYRLYFPVMALGRWRSLS